jgi:hypothetical protein
MIMSALYVMQYVGQIGTGAGAVYIGKGVIVGVDAGGGRYKGTYTEAGGRMNGNATVLVPHGATMVTGQQLPPGTTLQLTIDWPANFANGQPQPISIAGRQVQVTFEKIGDIP